MKLFARIRVFHVFRRKLKWLLTQNFSYCTIKSSFSFTSEANVTRENTTTTSMFDECDELWTSRGWKLSAKHLQMWWSNFGHRVIKCFSFSRSLFKRCSLLPTTTLCFNLPWRLLKYFMLCFVCDYFPHTHKSSWPNTKALLFAEQTMKTIMWFGKSNKIPKYMQAAISLLEHL